jgi:aminoglycoside phosphotransferase (APT) family kinase protein
VADPHSIAAELGSTLVASRPLAGGFSHSTDLLTLTDGQAVARSGGAAPRVEAAVMDLARAHVPVPEVLLVRDDVLVIEYVAGELLVPSSFELGLEVGRVVAAIGAVSFSQPGFFAGPDLTVAPEPPWSAQLVPMVTSCLAASTRLDAATADAWLALCAEHAPALSAVDDHTRLVHADINPKNILVSGDRVTAVLDWEFAYVGCPYGDAANMLRFDSAGPYGAGFREGFGLTEETAYLGRVLDMFALSDLLTRDADNPIADRAANVIREWVRTGVPR